MAERKRRTKKKLPKSRLLRKKGLDYPLLASVVILTLFGILMVYDASVVEAYRSFSDKFYFARQQLIWAGSGIFLLLAISLVPYRFFRAISVWVFAASLILLVAVLIPSVGTKALGARRWIVLAGVSLQPAELVKLSLILYLANFLEKKRRFLQVALIVGLVIGLIVLEPDLGTAAVVAGIGAAVYFYSGVPLATFAMLMLAGALAGIGLIASSEYRRARVATYLDPSKDPLGASYHIRQILIALGSGGLFGVGIGKSRQKYEYIPAATTDSIFAIVAEEVGFVGSALVIALFLVVFTRAFRIAKKAPDEFSSLLAGGIASWISLQTLLNLATVVALVPLTGVPLPFVSYGGSATITSLVGVGMLLSISRYEKGKQ